MSIQTDEEMEAEIKPAPLVVPRNSNCFKLGKIFGEDPIDILKIVQSTTHEVLTDEFQLLGDETIELVAMELD